MNSVKVCEYSRSRSFYDDLILQDQASGERSQDQWSSGFYPTWSANYTLSAVICSISNTLLPSFIVETICQLHGSGKKNAQIFFIRDVYAMDRLQVFVSTHVYVFSNVLVFHSFSNWVFDSFCNNSHVTLQRGTCINGVWPTQKPKHKSICTTFYLTCFNR